MKTLRQLLVVLAAIPVLAVSSSAFALDCTNTIQSIQIQSDQSVLIRFDNGSWHVLSTVADSATMRTMLLAVANAALLSGKSILTTYGGGSCTVTDFSSTPSRVRLLQ
jgi:hypothetical protein